MPDGDRLAGRALAEIAADLAVKDRWLRDFVREKKIPVLRRGRIIRFDRNALIALDDALRARPLTNSERAYREALYSSAPATRPLSAEGYVYFIAAAAEVKIGTANDPRARLGTLQIGTATKLRLIGQLPGGQALERKLHHRFAVLRIRGEWFRLEGALLKFLRRHFDA